jgi:hypothetical protein
MEGLDWRGGISVWNESIHATLHLLCSAIRERECQDLLGEGSLLCNQPCNASGDHLGLACPSASYNEEWPFAMRDRLVLFVIEIRK